MTKFKSLDACLKELEPFIRNGAHLQTGKPFKRFGGLRSREILANWLICVAINSERQGSPLIFTSDPQGGDGIICDTETETTWPTEHVMVPKAGPSETRSIETLILNAVELKQQKGGAAYASGKTLIVFLDSGLGEWLPNKVTRQLPPIDFDAVWVVGLQGVVSGKYIYGISRLHMLPDGNAPTWLIRIEQDFNSWDVRRLQ